MLIDLEYHFLTATVILTRNYLQGLDLSPYFLAVAQHKDKKRNKKELIRWIHANGEDTGLPPKSFDLVSIAYVVLLSSRFLPPC